MRMPVCVRECLQIVVDEKIIPAHELYAKALAYGEQWHALISELFIHVREHTPAGGPVMTKFTNAANRLYDELKG